MTNEERVSRALAANVKAHGGDADSTFHQLELGEAPDTTVTPAKLPVDGLISTFHATDASSLATDVTGLPLNDSDSTTVGTTEGPDGTTAKRRWLWQKTKELMNTAPGKGMATAFNRLGNVGEAMIAPAIIALNRADNMWMAYLTTPSKEYKIAGIPMRFTQPGLALDNIKRAVMPDVLYSPYAAAQQESTEIAEGLIQIGENVAKKEQGFWEKLDKEPMVIENNQRSKTYRDAIVARVFNGNEDEYDSWYMEQSAGGKFAHNVAFGGLFDTYFTPSTLITATKWASAPINFLAKYAVGKPAAALAKSTIVPAAQAVARKAPALRGAAMEVARVATTPLFTRNPTIGALDAAVTTAEARAARLQTEYDKIASPTPEMDQRLVSAQKRAAEARIRFANASVNINKDPVMMRMPRSDPKIISDLAAKDPDQALSMRPSLYRQLAGRRKEIAERIAPQKEVEEELVKVGFASWDDFLQRAGNIHREIKGGRKFESDPNLIDPLIEDMRRMERLPAHIKQHLGVRGLSRDKIASAAALMREPMDNTNIGHWADFSTSAANVERRLIGADNSEDIGQALHDIARGVSSEHVYVYDTLIPEHEVLSRGELPLWANDVQIGGDNSIWENGRKVLDGDEYYKHFGDRAVPGLQPGSKLLHAGRVMWSHMNPWSITQHARQPYSAWGKLPAANILKRADDNAHTWAVAANEAVEDAIKLHGVSDEGLGRVVRALDPDDDFQLEQALAKLSDNEAALYRKERARMDYNADRLGTQPGEALRHHFAHVWPDMDLEAQARIVELMGMDKGTTVGFRHLLPRLGAQGYTENYRTAMDVYNRLLFRKLIKEPAYEAAERTAQVYESRGLTGQAAYSRNLIKASRGHPLGLSYLIEQALGPEARKATDHIAGTVGGLLYSGMLVGKPAHLLDNVTSAMVNLGAEHGAFGTMRGVMRLFTPQGRRLAVKSGVAEQARYVMEDPQGFVKKINKIAGKTTGEDGIRYVAQQAALQEAIRESGKTWRQIVAEGNGHAYQAEAFDSVLHTQHLYGQPGRSPWFDVLLGRRISGLATQFSRFPGYAYKQSEMLLRHANEDPGALMRYFAAGGWAINTLSRLHVDAARSTGLGYLDAGRGKYQLLNSPEINFLVEMQNVSEAMAENDPSAVKLHGERASQLVTDMIPGLNVTLRAMKAYQESKTGSVESVAGGFSRQIAPGEKPARLLGLPTTEQRVANQYMEQGQQQIQDWYYQRRTVTEQFIKMVNEGDTEKAEAYMVRMAELGLPVSKDIMQAKIQAQYIGSILRMQMKHKKLLAPMLLNMSNEQMMQQLPPQLMEPQ